MEWRMCYLDLTLVPLGLLFPLVYHLWLWRRVRSRPLRTIIGINSAGRRLWLLAMIKDNEKKNILAVQTIRNTIMGSTLMATTSILLCSALAAVISSTYSVKRPLHDSVLGAHGELTVALKFVTLLLLFLFSFLCYSLSIRFLNQANFLVNVCTATAAAADAKDACTANAIITPAYVCGLLERGVVLNTVGNRLFYTALPVLLWIFGPVPVVFASLAVVLLLYKLDVVVTPAPAGNGNKVTERAERAEDDGV